MIKLPMKVSVNCESKLPLIITRAKPLPLLHFRRSIVRGNTITYMGRRSFVRASSLPDVSRPNEFVHTLGRWEEEIGICHAALTGLLCASRKDVTKDQIINGFELFEKVRRSVRRKRGSRRLNLRTLPDQLRFRSRVGDAFIFHTGQNDVYLALERLYQSLHGTPQSVGNCVSVGAIVALMFLSWGIRAGEAHSIVDFHSTTYIPSSGSFVEVGYGDAALLEAQHLSAGRRIGRQKLSAPQLAAAAPRIDEKNRSGIRFRMLRGGSRVILSSVYSFITMLAVNLVSMEQMNIRKKLILPSRLNHMRDLLRIAELINPYSQQLYLMKMEVAKTRRDMREADICDKNAAGLKALHGEQGRFLLFEPDGPVLG